MRGIRLEWPWLITGGRQDAVDPLNAKHASWPDTPTTGMCKGGVSSRYNFGPISRGSGTEQTAACARAYDSRRRSRLHSSFQGPRRSSETARWQHHLRFYDDACWQPLAADGHAGNLGNIVGGSLTFSDLTRPSKSVPLSRIAFMGKCATYFLTLRRRAP